MTFNSAINQCTYSGPKTLPYGRFTLDIVAGEIPEGSDIGFAMGTLKDGKTFYDLNAYSAPPTEPPDWFNVLGAIGPFTQNQSHSYDLSRMGMYTKGVPIYFVCFSGPRDTPIKTGTIGPIEVQE